MLPAHFLKASEQQRRKDKAEPSLEKLRDSTRPCVDEFDRMTPDLSAPPKPACPPMPSAVVLLSSVRLAGNAPRQPSPTSFRPASSGALGFEPFERPSLIFKSLPPFSVADCCVWLSSSNGEMTEQRSAQSKCQIPTAVAWRPVCRKSTDC